MVFSVVRGFMKKGRSSAEQSRVARSNKYSKALPHQTDLWLEHSLFPDDDVANQFVFSSRIPHRLSLKCLKQAVYVLVARHEALRTVFREVNGELFKEVLSADLINLEIVRCLGESEESIKDKIKEQIRKPFDLEIKGGCKFFIFQRADNEYYLLFSVHHISISLQFLELPVELAQIYSDILEGGEVTALKGSKKSFTGFERQYLAELSPRNLETLKNFWRGYLSKGFEAQKFVGKSLPSNSRHSPAVSSRFLDRKLVESLNKVSKLSSATTFCLFTAFFQVFISKLSGQERQVIGVPCDLSRGLVENVVGYTTNTLPIITSVDNKEAFKVFLDKFSQDFKRLMVNRFLPLSYIRDIAPDSKGMGGSRLFNYLSISHKAPKSNGVLEFCLNLSKKSIKTKNMELFPIGIGSVPTGRFDLALAVAETDENHIISFHFNSHCFDEQEIQRLLDMFIKGLEALAKAPFLPIGELNITSEQDLFLIREWNKTERPFPKGSFLEAFFDKAHEFPSADAVINNEGVLTYKQLNEITNQTARMFADRRRSERELIAVAINRSQYSISLLLGLLKAGIPFLPLDLSHPAERLNFILQDAKASLLITEEDNLHNFHKFSGKILSLRDVIELSKSVDDSDIDQLPSEDDLAYVIYTSGSTGKPKGVEIQHGALNNLLFSIQDIIRLNERSKFLALTTVSFDISILELLLPLITGGVVVLGDDWLSKDPVRISREIKKHQITHCQATPSTWRMLIETRWKGDKSLTVLCGGESLTPNLSKKILERAQCLWNLYGPTETTIWSSVKFIDDPDQDITIGRPISNTTFFILDKDLKQVPIGTIGEIYIGGYGLAKGYRNNPELSYQRFIPSPYPNSLSNRLYQTGDLGRYLPNGEIECLGRTDNQVKINGFRIETGEIEEALKQHTLVTEAVVVLKETDLDAKQLVAYFTGDIGCQDLRVYLEGCLPQYMIPHRFVQLDSFQLSQNNKIDRKALPDPTDFLEQRQVTAPEGDVEFKICGIFSKLLNLREVGRDDNFFSLGGHSLLAAQCVFRINDVFQVKLPLHLIYESPTPEGLAKAVELANKTAPECPVFEPVTHETALSKAQERFWFLNHLFPESPLYSVPFVVELSGDVNETALLSALESVVERQTALRSTFVNQEDHVVLTYQDSFKDIVTTIDLREDADSFQLSEMLIKEELQRPFDLQKGPLFAFKLFRVDEDRARLFINFHHIVFDGFSLRVFLEDLKTLYESSQTKSTLPLKVDYCAYISHQKSQSNYRDDKWWEGYLSDAPLTIELPYDKSKKLVSSYKGEQLEFFLPKSVQKSLMTLAKEHNTTLFTVLLSLFHILLYKYTGQNDILIGVPFSDRDLKEFEHLVGCFINTLPIRTTSRSELTFSELLRNVQNSQLLASAHKLTPFEKIVESIDVDRSSNSSPVFQVMLNLLPETTVDKVGDMDVSITHLDRGMADLDLSLSCLVTKDGLKCLWEYSTELFHKTSMKQMIRHFKNLAKDVSRDPSQEIRELKMLSKKEVTKQVETWNQSCFHYDSSTSILDMFDKQVALNPDAVAVTFKQDNVTYEDLNKRANQVANTLIEQGIQGQDRVGLMFERSLDFMAAVLGVLKAGGVYVPISPEEPQDRVEIIVDEINPFAFILQSHLDVELPSGVLRLNIEDIDSANDIMSIRKLSSSNLAYIIYTSGSTGRPKGVKISHESIQDRLHWKMMAYPFQNSDSMLHTYSFNFDGAVINYFWPLCIGGTLTIASKEEILEPTLLLEAIQENEITFMDLLPSLLQGVLEVGDPLTLHSLKHVFSGGEALTFDVIKLFFKKCSASLHNTYGPTEATVESSVYEISEGYRGPYIAPIGKPLADARLYVLDADKNPVPIGVRGELHIGGSGLAEGYLNDEKLTSEKFIPDPFGSDVNSRMYCTGDAVKFRSDGNIDFLGRIDNQIKIRGFRVELGEIEAALLELKDVHKAVVIPIGQGVAKRLVAFIVTNSAKPNSDELIKNSLKKTLPPYMVPSQIVFVESFPTLRNGKINTKALSDTVIGLEFGRERPRPPNQGLETQLLSCWEHVLESNHINVNDNFFEIGGNSLVAMRLKSQLNKRLGYSLPLARFFEYPTIEDMAHYLETTNGQSKWSPLVKMKTSGNGTPFFLVHPVGGNVLCYKPLADQWDLNRPFYALQARGLDGNQVPHQSIQAMAQEYITEMRTVQKKGPYFIGGWSFGGLVAAEMVSQLKKLGETVSLLVLIDTTSDIESLQDLDSNDPSQILSELTKRYGTQSKNKKSLKHQFVQYIENGGKGEHRKSQREVDRLIELVKSNYVALKDYKVPVLDTHVVLLKSSQNLEKTPDLGWARFAQSIDVFEAPGDHWGITERKLAPHYSNILAKSIEKRAAHIDTELMSFSKGTEIT